MRFMSLLFATTLLSMTAGCGDDGGGSGVSGSKKLEDLSSSEITTLCRGAQAKFNRLSEAFTVVSCTQFAYGEDTCEADAKQCIDDPSPDDTLEGEFTCTNTDNEFKEGCPELTVKEFETCLEALTKAIETFADKFTCEAEITDLEEPTTPKSCTDLGNRCPTLSEDFFGP